MVEVVVVGEWRRTTRRFWQWRVRERGWRKAGEKEESTLVLAARARGERTEEAATG